MLVISDLVFRGFLGGAFVGKIQTDPDCLSRTKALRHPRPLEPPRSFVELPFLDRLGAVRAAHSRGLDITQGPMRLERSPDDLSFEYGLH